jgi:hypothetical protein
MENDCPPFDHKIYEDLLENFVKKIIAEDD